MKYKYIIEELHKENKILKWIAMIFSDIGLFLTILIIGNILIAFFGITIGLIVLGVIGILELALMVFIFNRMFPKVEKMSVYKTGGFVSTLVILILSFLFTMFVPSIIAFPFIFILTQLPFIVLILVDFFLIMGSFALLWLVIIPFGLKLPNGKETLKQYSTAIGLKPFDPSSLNNYGYGNHYGRNFSLGLVVF